MPRASRGAKASREVFTVVTPGNVEVVRRVRAPLELTDEQAAEFQRTVSVMPAEWFCPGNTALLAQLSRHVITARRIAQMIERAILAAEDDTVEGRAAGRQVFELEKMQLRESAMISRLMTQLRLTPQAVAPRGVSAKAVHEVESPWSGLKQITSDEA